MTEYPLARPHGYELTPWVEQPGANLGPGTPLGPTEPSESILRHYWRMFYRRRWLVLAIVAAFVGLALLISIMMQRQYTAETRIQIAREATKIVNMEGVEDEASAVDKEFYQTQYALLMSRSLSEAVVRSLRLADNPMFLANYDRQEAAEMAELPRSERFELATDIVNKNTAVAPVRDSSIVDVAYQSPVPAMAATIANEIAEKFIETNLARRFDATSYAREFLQNRINAVRTRLEESERRAADYARAQRLINIQSSAGGGQVTTEQSLPTAELAQLTSQLAQARADRERAAAEFRANSGGRAATESLTNTTVAQLRQQRGQLVAELRKLQSDFGPDYPRVRALQAQVNELDRQIGQEEGVVRSGVSRDISDRYRQALANERGLQSRVDQLKNAVLDQQQRSIQYNIIQRDVDTNRALYDALLQRFKEVGVAAGVGTNNVSIVDRALPPEVPSSPNLPLNLALGLFLGIFVGAATAFMLEQLAESMILPAEFQRKLGIPLLGTTPASQIGVSRKLLGSRQAVKAEERQEVVKSSEVSEAYFSILTAVQFSTSKGAPKTMSITSSQQGEGKSTSALALARGLAGVGARVLLIDADMRNPSLHRTLQIPQGRGLSDFLTRHAELNDLLRETDTSGLSAIIAGPIPPNPAELLASGGLERLINAADDQFDHIIFDSPPVLGLADAPLIARAVEGTLFVVESARTRSSQAKNAIDRLAAVRAHIIGAILTKLDSKNSGYGYGYGYNYAYGK